MIVVPRNEQMTSMSGILFLEKVHLQLRRRNFLFEGG